LKTLVIAAHPDDEILGCGGTIARLAREEYEVYLAILGEGITSRFDRRDQADFSQVEALRKNSRKAAELLGAKDIFHYDLPDNRFDTLPLLDMVKLIEGLIEKLAPEVVYTHHGGDLNLDHAVVFRATLTATRPKADCPVREVYAYEVPSSTEWAFQQLPPVFAPDVFVDIEDTLELKIKAMGLYESESTTFPHPRSPEALRAVAGRWGSAAGLKAAEAFVLIRKIY